MLSGSIVAIVTPMQDDGRLDFERFKSLIDFHIEQGSDGIVVVGIKDATANIERGSDLLRRAPKGFAVYSGDDVTGLALMLLGAKGIISVPANVAPRLMHEMCSAALAGDVKKARELNFKLLGLHTKLFVEANPIPVKWALAQMGLIGMGIRLPLTPLSQQFHEVVREAMRQADVTPASGLRSEERRVGKEC